MKEMNRYIEMMSCKIASFIYAQAVLNSSEGNWCVSFDEIKERFGIDLNNQIANNDFELLNAIEEELFNYQGVLDVEIDLDKDFLELSKNGIDIEGNYSNNFDIIIGTDYLANDYDIEEEE